MHHCLPQAGTAWVASLGSNVVSTWPESEAGGLSAQDWTLLSPPWYAACSIPHSPHMAPLQRIRVFTGCAVHVQTASSVQTPDKFVIQETCWSLRA